MTLRLFHKNSSSVLHLYLFEWHLVNYKITCYHSFDERNSLYSRSAFCVRSAVFILCVSALCTRSAVCILNLVCISVPGQQSAICILYWPLSYQCLRSLRRFVRHFKFLWRSPLYTRFRTPVPGSGFRVPGSPFLVLVTSLIFFIILKRPIRNQTIFSLSWLLLVFFF